MADRLTREQRHRCMAHIGARNTKPEIIVRKYLWAHGVRYRLNHPQLPGKPDIVLRSYRTCIFVNGCFWHGHEGCKFEAVDTLQHNFSIQFIFGTEYQGNPVVLHIRLNLI